MNREELHQSILKNTKVTFARSGGKGGQNVNKVNTKVCLMLPLYEIEGLSDEEKILLRQKLDSMINADNCLYLNVDDERFQEVNRKIAFDRLESRIVNALKVQKKRRPTKPTAASRERKLKAKKIRSELKKSRSRLNLY